MLRSARTGLTYSADRPARAVAVERSRQDAELGAGFGRAGQPPVLTGAVGNARECLVEQRGGVEADERGERSGHSRDQSPPRSTEQAGRRSIRLRFRLLTTGGLSPALEAGSAARRIDTVRPWAGSAFAWCGPAVQHAEGHAGGPWPPSGPILAAESGQGNDGGHSPIERPATGSTKYEGA